jgi:hypothetical protein
MASWGSEYLELNQPRMLAQNSIITAPSKNNCRTSVPVCQVDEVVATAVEGAHEIGEAAKSARHAAAAAVDTARDSAASVVDTAGERAKHAAEIAARALESEEARHRYVRLLSSLA